MRRLAAGLATALAAGVLVTAAAAQEGAAPQRPGRDGPRRGMRGPGGGPGGAMLDNVIKELKLSEDQDKRVRQILDTFRQEMQTWMQQSGQQMRDLFGKARGQGADAEAARKKLQEIGQERQKKVENLIARLKDVLNAEQLAKVQAVLEPRGGPGGMMGARAMEQLGLTDEQKKKAKEITDAAMEAAKGKSFQERGEIMRKARDQINKEVLTDEQRKKLESLRPQGPGGFGGRFDPYAGLDLTDAQKEQVKKINDEAREKASKAEGFEARREVMQAARKKITDEVLTDAQRKKLEERRQRGPGQGGFRRGGSPGGQRAPAGGAPPPVD